MSADASLTLAWATGEHRFRLAIGQLRELQETINKPRVAIGAPPIGPMSLLRLLAANDAWPDETREVLRLGLIGGGTTPLDALALIKRYCDDRPLAESVPVAQAVLMAALVGVPDDIVGKKAAAEMTATEATTASSSPLCTETAPPLDGPQVTSTTPPSGNSVPPSMAGTERMVASRSRSPQATPTSTR